jgi:hypothetical protein
MVAMGKGVYVAVAGNHTMVGVGVSLGGKGVGVSVGGRAVGWAQADSHTRLRDKNKTRQE